MQNGVAISGSALPFMLQGWERCHLRHASMPSQLQQGRCSQRPGHFQARIRIRHTSQLWGHLPAANLLGTPGDLSSDARLSPLVVATMCNLLSVGGDGHVAKLPGLYMGEGLPPVPLRVVERIHKWEFIDMAELLLE